MGELMRSSARCVEATKVTEVGDVGREVVGQCDPADRDRFPLVTSWNGFAGHCGSVRDLATTLYGRPDDFRTFVDRAHAVGLGVILDVVYNHLGPDGNYLAQFDSDNLPRLDECILVSGALAGFRGPL